MTTLTFPHIDYVQRTQLLAYIKRKNIVFDISEPDEQYNPEFVAKIHESIEQEKNGQTVKINIDDIWK